MRLTCPACGAAYDVPDDAIPAAGREVECSDCGAVWQARNPAMVPVPRPSDDRFAIERALARAVTAEAQDRPHGGTNEEEALDEEEAPPLPGFAAAPKRRPLDDSILRILREEAARETRARAAERFPVETQPELGLTMAEPSRPSSPLVPTLPPGATAETASRTEQPTFPAPDNAPTRHNRFGTGFLLSIALAAAALYTYVAAPGIAAEFPSLAPALDSYVSFVDALRLWLAETAVAVRRMAGG